MIIDEFIERLSTGQDVYWDYIVEQLVSSYREQEIARSALQKCLEKKLPEYEHLAKHGHKDYWEPRWQEAKDAFQALQDGSAVKFRDIILENRFSPFPCIDSDFFCEK